MEKTLDQKIAELEGQSFKLHADIMREPFLGHKKPLMAKRAKILQEINDLRLKKEELENKEYTEKLEDLIRENRELIFFSVRNTRIPIPEDLTVELVFHPCSHKEKWYLPNLLTKPHIPMKSLFEMWVHFLNSNEIRSCSHVPCQECRKERPSTLRGKSILAEPFGHIDWTLRRLQ